VLLTFRRGIVQLALNSFKSALAGSGQTLSGLASTPRNRKLALGAGIVSVAAIAWATTWGPFLMKAYYPNVNYAYDVETHFAHVAYWRQDTCPWDSGYKEIPTGYWASKVEQTGENEFTHSAWYVSTGTKSVYIKGSGCK
jgi:hypothetical protein